MNLGKGYTAQLGILCLAIWLHAANSMLAATTLPSAVAEIGGAHLMGWAFSLYQMGSIIAGATSPLIVTKYSLKASLICAAIIYATGCFLTTISPDIVLFLVGRLVQGAGGGLMLALSFIAVYRLFPAHFIPKIIALFSVVWSTSAFCGPLVGGAFATAGVWRLAYGSFAIQASIFVILAFVFIKEVSRPPQHETAEIPVFRLALLGLTILMISYAAVDVHVLYSPLLVLAGLFLLWVCFHQDKLDNKARIFPKNALILKTIVGTGFVLVFILFISSMAFLVYGTALLSMIFDVSPLTAGYIVAIESVAWGIDALVFANSKTTSEPWLFRIGTAIITASSIGLAFSMSGNTLWPVLVSATFQGAGFGMMWSFVVRRIISHAETNEQEKASSAVPVISQIGMAIGAAAINIIANSVGFDMDLGLRDAQHVAFWIFAGFIPLLFVGNVLAWRFARNMS